MKITIKKIWLNPLFPIPTVWFMFKILEMAKNLILIKNPESTLEHNKIYF